VVITGGSRGLGLALAQRLAAEGARLTLIARDAHELERARQLVHERSPGAQLLLIDGDLTEPDTLLRAFQKVERAYGGIDMLINNAGSISVGPFRSMELEDFEAQMQLHLYAVIEAVKQALPYLEESRGRRIVNICSVGGKVPVPHMLPYDASKFALAGFSQGIAAELAADGISITTVYPTVMRTGSPIQAVFKGDHEKEYAWFALADVFPGLSMSADTAARKIVEAARERRADLTPSVAAQARVAAGALFPEITAWTMRKIAGLLPRTQNHQRRTGADSRAAVERSWLAWPLVRRARHLERQLNQAEKHDADFNLGVKHPAKPADYGIPVPKA
jgi:short-subunit dehydrogenase